MTRSNRQWVLAERPEGRAVRPSDFRWVETPVPALAAGEFLVQARYLALAPVMRSYMLNTAQFERPLNFGDVIHGRGVGEVVESRNDQFRVGEIVHGKFGWQDYRVCDGSPYYMMYKVQQRIVPISTALGVLGITGFTSYLGLVDIGRVRAGDTVLVSGAAGGVGSSVGQIARWFGAEAVGIAGSDEKCRMLIERCGYRAAINYKTEDIERRIGELCPNGVSIYFDNVNGPILDAGLPHLQRHARLVLCGAISQYINGAEQPYALKNSMHLFKKMTQMRAFFIYEMAADFPRAEAALAEMVAAGKLTYQEDILEGLERMPEALMRLYEGRNMGKQLVRVS
jgi:NADPH-dependent curcumin reductase CurA